MLHDNYNIKIQFRIDDETANKLLIYCQDHGLTSSQLLRILVEQFLNDNK